MPFWESGQLKIRSLYSAGSNQQINASIGVYIGLRGLNVTLIGLPPVQNGDLIDYNEHFSWTWLQGRPGFGYDGLTIESYSIIQLYLFFCLICLFSWKITSTVSKRSTSWSSISNSMDS